jgi:hypothetical protein
VKITIPGQNEPISLGGGPVNPTWYPALKSLEKLSSITDSISGSFAIAQITPGSTSVSVTTPAISDGGNNGTGVVHNDIGYNSTSGTLQSLYDSFTSIAFYINKIRTDLTADQTAVSALNSRVTALENKVDEIITDLASRFP